MSDSTNISGLKRSWQWLDKNGLLVLAFFLLVFIPLYPKLPLFDAIPGYLVKVRLEDVLVVLTGCWWLKQVLQKKVEWWSTIIVAIIAYSLVGFISVLSGIFLIQTIPLEALHVGKSLLHYFRHLEYFSLFVFLFSALKARNQVQLLVRLLSMVVVLVVVYAIGQLYWEWPVFSTMNREYSKGGALTLGVDARVQSTFAGHYDLSAFLVLLLPYLSLAALSHPKWSSKLWYGGVSLAGFWLLLETGSKFSLLAGIIGLTVALLLYLRRYRRVLIGLVSIGGLTLFLCLATSWWIWAYPQSQLVENTFTKATNSPLVQNVAPVAKTVRKIDTLLRPALVQHLPVATEDQSENTRKYGLSMGIRLDTLWPQALRGLARNVTLGSGYGTLNKNSASTFVEADSTDNNLLRTAGETGLLGFITFYLIIWLLGRTVWKVSSDGDWLFESLSIGFLGAIVGIILNGLMIDVFVASKVAFTFWALAGISIKAAAIARPDVYRAFEKQRIAGWTQVFKDHWPLLTSLLLLLILLARNPLLSNGQVANLALDPSTAGVLTTLSNVGTNLYKLYLLFFYAWWSAVGVFYYANLLLAVCTIFLLDFIVRNLSFKTIMRFGVLISQVGILFLSQVTLLPLVANLALTLLLLLMSGYWYWSRTKRPGWALVTGGASLALCTVLFHTSFTWWWVVLSPLFVLVSFWGLNWLQLQLKQVPSWVITSTGLGLVVTVIAVQVDISQHFQQLLTEYRAAGKYANVQSVRVMNDVTSSYDATEGSTQSQPPVIFSALDAQFIQLYQANNYLLQPLGDFNRLKSELWPTSRPILVSNAGLKSEIDRMAFLNIRHQVDVDLVTDGCDETCNVYQINRQPNLHWQPILADEEEYSFIVFNQIILRADPVGMKLLENHLLQLQKKNHLPDFVVAMSDAAGAAEVSLPSPTGDITLPIYFLASSTSPKVVDEYLSLRTPHDLLLFVHMTPDGTQSSTQHLKHLNALVDAELDSSLKNIFVITDRMAWAEEKPEYAALLDRTERTTLPAKPLPNYSQLRTYLTRTPAQKIYMMSGDFGQVVNTKPSFIYDQSTDNRISFIGSSVRWRPTDVYLEVNVKADGQAQVEAKLLTTHESLTLDTYGL